MLHIKSKNQIQFGHIDCIRKYWFLIFLCFIFVVSFPQWHRDPIRQAVQTEKNEENGCGRGLYQLFSTKEEKIEIRSNQS